MAVLPALQQGVIDWLKLAGGGLTNAQVILANEKGMRPPIPYLTVNIQAADQNRHIRDEAVRDIAAGAPTVKQRGTRRAVAFVQGFGDLTHEWLSLAQATLPQPAIQAQLDLSGFSVLTNEPILDVSSLVDTEIEGRYARDFTLNYLVETDPETQVEWLVGELGMTLIKFDGDPDPLVVPMTTE